MTQTAQPTDKHTAVATIEEGSIADQVLHRVTTMEAANELTLPDGYHVGNALKSAWLYIQSIKDKADRPATQTCTRASIANCLLEMVIRGEHPMHHCYFIPTGNQLTFWEKYTGKLMRAKRDTDIKSVNAQVVYKGDEFTYTVDEDGRYQLVSHKTSIQNMTPANIVAAYAVVIMRDGSRHIEVMTLGHDPLSLGTGSGQGQQRRPSQLHRPDGQEDRDSPRLQDRPRLHRRRLHLRIRRPRRLHGHADGHHRARSGQHPRPRPASAPAPLGLHRPDRPLRAGGQRGRGGRGRGDRQRHGGRRQDP